MKEIIVYTDYVCPFCLITEPLIREAIKGKELKVTWRPHELRPFPVPTLNVEDGYLPSIWQRAVYPMAKKLGVELTLPTISPQPRTTKAFEAFAFAETQGLGDAFSMATLSSFFQKNQDIGETDVLLNIAQEIGLDPVRLKKSLASNEFTETHKRALNKAKKNDKINVVPTIIIGDERFEGVPDRKWLKSAINKLYL
jgi:predicted DsbA family dithiol-disulfide isomerase